VTCSRDHGPGVAEARAEALSLLPPGGPDGEPLTSRLAALVTLGCAAAATTLDREGARTAAIRALDAGATADEVHEAVVLVAALGAHALHEGSRVVADILRERGDPRLTGPPQARAAALVDGVLRDPYWARLDEELPGFLEALARLSPDAFEAFRAFTAVPWRHGVLPAREKELIYLAVDAMPSHRYLPGLCLHVRNALDRGASPAEIRGALDIAAAAGPARGIPRAARR
jgi:alkylhydroperoxidase/carboxymuconolactone decarboxylase family protein YurZ